MGQLLYGQGEGSVNASIPDETLLVVDEAIRDRFVTGDNAGKPFRIWMSGQSGSPSLILYVSAGVPLRIQFDQELELEAITDETRALMKKTLEGLESDGTLFIPGMVTD